MSKAIILINDPLTPILKKGEAVERYYNPENIFSEVHIVLCNDDQPNRDMLQFMVGAARLHVHNLAPPSRFFWRTLGWQQPLMSSWLATAEKLSLKIKPDLIRCFGAHINATAARVMAKACNVPSLISLHSRPDAPPAGISLRERLKHAMLERLAKHELLRADLVLAVYKSQLPYLGRIGVGSVELAYNVLNKASLSLKESYDIQSEVKVLSVGRLIPGKNPENLVRAVPELHNLHLTIVGDGPLREKLEWLSYDLGVSRRVEFIRAIDNASLCESMPEYDIFATHNDYPGIPKAVMEPLSCGLPVLLNLTANEVVPELSDDICLLVDNSKEGYVNGLKRLISDHALRKALGERAKKYSNEVWAPEKAEARYADIYRHALDQER